MTVARMEPNSAALEFRAVRKAYGSVQAVRDLSISVQPGEVLTLLGSSGSGKTTTLMMAAGFVQPDSGEILIEGRDITWLPPELRNVGVVFQSYALFPHRTVAENVAFPLRMRKVAGADRRKRVADVLELVRLEGLDRRYPRELSGGQQQRVALARAIVYKPPILLMDEPLGALDHSLRKEMQFELKRLQEEIGQTIVYVTHDQEEALTLSTRIAVLHDGEIEQIATPDDLYRRPRTAFVARFMGDTNLISGRVVAKGILESDGGVRVPLSPDVVPGAVITLAIRLEDVTITARGTDSEPRSSDSGVRLPATVRESLYLGDAWLYEAEGPVGLRFRVKTSAGKRTTSFARGDEVDLLWNFEDALVLTN
jgi:putative spermidine/putrescine transport system ATP-binding protein